MKFAWRCSSVTVSETPCHHCGENNRTDSTVCRFCHRALDELRSRECPSCAEPIPFENPRCHFCGTLSQSKPKGPEPPSPPYGPSSPPSPPNSPSTGPSGSVPPAPSRVPKKPIPPLKEEETAAPLPEIEEPEEELPLKPLVSPKKRKRND